MKSVAFSGAALASGVALRAAAASAEKGESAERGGPDASPRSERPRIQLAGYPFDRVRGLVDGRVELEGCDTSFSDSSIYKLNAMAMGGSQDWEIQEIGLHPFMLAYANQGFRDYTLIPVFPLRTFRHKSIFVRTDRQIDEPADLRGKTVGVAGYSQSSLTWIRGILQHEYGVEPKEMKWVVSSASSDKGKVSEQESTLPTDIEIEAGPPGMDESQLLVEGALDAVFSAKEPQAFVDGDPLVVRLFADSRAVEQAYYAKTGIFPIMHVVAIRSDVVEKYPWLPKTTFDAYSQAKTMMYRDMRDVGWVMISLPWLGQELEDTRKRMGENFWEYGFSANNVKTLNALFQYSHEQGLAKRQLTIEELFHPSTLGLLESS